VLAHVISQTLNVRAGPSTDHPIIAVLSHGQMIELSSDVSRWARVRHNGRDGFAPRRFLAQSPDTPVLRLDDATETLVSEVIWRATERYDASITYRLGCKARAQGLDSLVFSGTDIARQRCSGSTVDCSGWVSGLFQLVAANVNASTGVRVFDARDTGRLSTHSDGQIVNVGQVTGQIWSGSDIDSLDLRSGLLFGLDNGDHDWEGRNRVFELDHIVMGVSSPTQGYHVTQSSSSGGGVNRVPWRRWRERVTDRFAQFKIQCVDLLALGSWQDRSASSGSQERLDVELPNPDPMGAAPG
jgi:SH3-like domain-containing protein